MSDRAARYGRSAFATGLFLALVVAGWGFVSLLSDTDVVSDASIGPLVAPLAVGGSTIAVFFALASPSWAGRAVAALRVVVAAVVVGLLAVGVYLLALGTIQLVATGRPTALVLIVASQAPTAYALVIAVAGALAALGLAGISTRTRRPLWPWEQHDEDGPDDRSGGSHP